MSNTTENSTKTGNGKWWVGYAATFASAFTVKHLEQVYGPDFFKMAGLDPAILEGLMEGTFVGFFVWVTPGHLVDSITDAILFIKSAFKKWRDAISDNQSKGDAP